jgi:hypothetical protein
VAQHQIFDGRVHDAAASVRPIVSAADLHRSGGRLDVEVRTCADAASIKAHGEADALGALPRHTRLPPAVEVRIGHRIGVDGPDVRIGVGGLAQRLAMAVGEQFERHPAPLQPIDDKLHPFLLNVHAARAFGDGIQQE